MDRELEALTLAARERGERLSEREVAKPHGDEVVADARGGGDLRGAEELGGAGGGQLEDVCDIKRFLASGEPEVEDGVSKASALADFAGHVDAGHEAEFDEDRASAVAVGAGALGVRGEERGFDAIGLGKGAADGIERAGVRRGIGAARALHGFLIHEQERTWQAVHK